ncbi:DUF4296 domain-containing protein [Psychroflexus tropicus]|uniref:DUF4296 domain-containing protein n=1 Tax=Psychroflexus tropicus TaxID=197345 RepID=UPI00036BAAB1|nr:DUF4296 domain-containing protein [Psychroflexus tropicus]
MKLIFALGLLNLFLLLSCQDVKEVEKPNTLLTKSEMKDLIYDMVLLDAATGVNEKRLEELDVEMLEFLSLKYKIDSTDLKQNLLYYNLKFDENLEIYQKVKDSITRLEKAYDSISEVTDSLRRVEKKKQDSIRKLDTIPKKIMITRDKSID